MLQSPKRNSPFLSPTTPPPSRRRSTNTAAGIFVQNRRHTAIAGANRAYMGASLSNLGENGSGSGGPGLGDIPESCVACVFLYLSPPEICNLARLNRAFRGAASSDAVWEAKLPSNYHHLLQLLSQPVGWENLPKKDIFALLSRPNPFDDGNKVRAFPMFFRFFDFDFSVYFSLILHISLIFQSLISDLSRSRCSYFDYFFC